jgi:hypothetical protein
MQEGSLSPAANTVPQVQSNSIKITTSTTSKTVTTATASITTTASTTAKTHKGHKQSCVSKNKLLHFSSANYESIL